MCWERVIGQHHAKDILIAAIRRGCVAHAYCIWGPDGVGKDALAIEFARVLNCSTPVVRDNCIEACDHCKDCLQISMLQHPNVQLIFSLPAASKSGSNDDESPILRLTDDQISQIQEQLLLKARNPYHDISIPHATQIRIAAIRDVRRTLQLSPPVGHGWRVVIISEADAMTLEAANAFLKTLEEPHARTTLILTTSRPDKLPPTVLSRCQRIHCGYLDEESIAMALVQREQVPLERARILAALAQGSYARALKLSLAADEDVLTDTAIHFLRLVLKQGRFRTELLTMIEQQLNVYDRMQVILLLRMILTWFHDAYRLSLHGSSAEPYLVFRHGNLRQALARFVERFAPHSYDTAIAAVESAITAIENNAQIPLTLVTLAIRLRRCMLPQSSL